MPPLAGTDRCWAHAPGRARDRAAARKRGGHRAQASLVRGPQAAREPVVLTDVASVRRLLEGAFDDTLVQRNSLSRVRTLGFLIGLAIRVFETGELEARIAELEAWQAKSLGGMDVTPGRVAATARHASTTDNAHPDEDPSDVDS